MSDRIEWPRATADLFVDAAGIAAYIDCPKHDNDPATAEKDYREDLAEIEAAAQVDAYARHELDETLAMQRSALTAMLDALMHLGAARWEYMCNALASDHVSWSNEPCPNHSSRRRLIIEGPVEDDPYAS